MNNTSYSARRIFCPEGFIGADIFRRWNLHNEAGPHHGIEMFGPVSLNINLWWNWYLRFTPFISLNYDPSLMIIFFARKADTNLTGSQDFSPDNGPTCLESRLFDLRYAISILISPYSKKKREIIIITEKPNSKIFYINNDKYNTYSISSASIIIIIITHQKHINFHFYHYIPPSFA